jgi:hypothetical protein
MKNSRLDYILDQTNTGSQPAFKLSMIAMQVYGTVAVVISTTSNFISSGQTTASILMIAGTGIFITHLTSQQR